jgi:histidinol phosphatase-like PHP family hydrolase
MSLSWQGCSLGGCPRAAIHDAAPPSVVSAAPRTGLEQLMPDTPLGRSSRHLRTDLHTHTTFSDGRADVAATLAAARRAGFELGISDHYSIPYGMQGDRTLARYLDALEQFPVYRAVELDIGAEQPISPENLAKLDYCVGSLHLVLDADGTRVLPDRGSASSLQYYMRCVVEQYERALRLGMHAMIGHPMFLPDLPRDGQEELWTGELQKRFIAAVVDSGVALELSTRYRVPSEETVREALAAGALFAVASDGHGPEAIGAVDYARRLALELEIPDDRFFLPQRQLPGY